MSHSQCWMKVMVIFFTFLTNIKILADKAMICNPFDWKVETDVALNILKNNFILNLTLTIFNQLFLKFLSFILLWLSLLFFKFQLVQRNSYFLFLSFDLFFFIIKIRNAWIRIKTGGKTSRITTS